MVAQIFFRVPYWFPSAISEGTLFIKEFTRFQYPFNSVDWGAFTGARILQVVNVCLSFVVVIVMGSYLHEFLHWCGYALSHPRRCLYDFSVHVPFFYLRSGAKNRFLLKPPDGKRFFMLAHSPVQSYKFAIICFSPFVVSECLLFLVPPSLFAYIVMWSLLGAAGDVGFGIINWRLLIHPKIYLRFARCHNRFSLRQTEQGATANP